WTEKYRSTVIRPESYINQYIDPEWKPLIQTPPFPEHTSGHSTITAAAAMVLTNLLGDNFTFTDSTEVEFGIPPRTFNSFLQAADEAAISRLYGGIHYPHGNQAGNRNGKMVGQYVFDKLHTRKGK
ncbi:MAG TPA: vanadium-dependent haloperoxidase, partial [Saprospiraceae bacterium]|nr:vanadium-dependent haloperoxidase [Saprospiraceae bacterium]